MKYGLCVEDFESLEGSHIIPECMYEKVYDDKGSEKNNFTIYGAQVYVIFGRAN